DPAGDEVAAPARLAVPAVAAVPAEARALPNGPARDAVAHRVDDARDLVPGRARGRDARPGARLRERIAVTDAARLDPEAYLLASGRRDLALHQLERPAGAGDLCDAHLRHDTFLDLTRGRDIIV